MTDTAPPPAIIDRVRKLLALAERKQGNEAEAAAAAAKAQELLALYNLSMSTVEQSPQDGKREDARVRGGMYHYERDLWRAVAELNFCFYFHSWRWRTQSTKYGPVQRRQFMHRVVGRQVNSQSTIAMSGYLQQTIERLCRERLATSHAPGDINSQYFSSWAVAFREGAAERVMEKLRDRRRDLEQKQAAEAKARAARAGASTATALTLQGLAEQEADANTDFLYGEGTSAKRAARQAERAKAEEEADAAATAWAAANPEEAAAQAKKEAAESRKYWARRANSRTRYRAPDGREVRQNSGAYAEGWDAGAKVGLDPQTEQKQAPRLVRSAGGPR